MWGEDEGRIGLKPVLRRVWTIKGERPSSVSVHKYEWLYQIAFVHPATGRSFWLIVPEINAQVMTIALKEFADFAQVGKKKKVLLVWDRAAWHSSLELEVPEGIELIQTPAYTPELQPAERLWPLRNEAIANKQIDDLDALEQVLIKRCKEIVEQPELVKGLTKYHWWPDL